MASPVIYVIRHAEKPDDIKDSNLSATGFLRQQFLTDWFPKTFGMPDFIYASTPTNSSQRPYQTVFGLSAAANMPTALQYADEEYDRLAMNIAHHGKHFGKTTLVCWHHGRIPALLHELGAEKGTYPNHWPSDDFETVFKLEYTPFSYPKVTSFKMPFEVPLTA